MVLIINGKSGWSVQNRRSIYINLADGLFLFQQIVCFLSFCSLYRMKKYKNIEKECLRTQKKTSYPLQFANNA